MLSGLGSYTKWVFGHYTYSFSHSTGFRFTSLKKKSIMWNFPPSFKWVNLSSVNVKVCLLFNLRQPIFPCLGVLCFFFTIATCLNCTHLLTAVSIFSFFVFDRIKVVLFKNVALLFYLPLCMLYTYSNCARSCYTLCIILGIKLISLLPVKN